MAKANGSTKKIMLDKANARIVLIVSIAVFVTVFSLVSAKTLIGQAAYQNRIISKKKAAVSQLRTNTTTVKQLDSAYTAFVNTSPNIIGGTKDNVSQPNSGNNAQIILNALPSGYDFPGLTTSLENLLTEQHVSITNITGTDDEINQSSNQSSATPKAVPIPFQITATGNYDSMQNVINAFQRSIRPIQISNMDITGNNSGLTLNVTAQTYYQPAKSLGIHKEEVK